MKDDVSLPHQHAPGDFLSSILALSDITTALAYFVIPVALCLFIYQQKDLKFKRILVLFILFILACGFQHFLHFTSVWLPMPKLLAGVMAFMAIISIVTAVAIWPVLRQIAAFVKERAALEEELTHRNGELENALLAANSSKESLEQSRKAFRQIIADAPIGMAIVSLDGNFTLVNKALCDIVGYKASELEKLTFQKITHPDDLDTDLFQVGLLLDGMSEKYSLEKRYIHSSGNEVNVQLDVTLVRDEQDQPKYFIAQIQDITANKRTHEALVETQHHFKSLLKNLPTAVVVHRADSSIEYANPVASDLLGLSEDQLLGKTAVDPDWHFTNEDGSAMELDNYPVMKVMSDKRPLHNYLTGIIPKRNAPIRWVLVNAFPLKSPAGALDSIIVSFIDITERKRLECALEEQAQTDPLTGLFNRRYFQQTVARELTHARRSNSSLSIMMLDLDHFKQINDKYGHSTGDKVLIAFSEIISEIGREDDIACRYGGEEFIILMRDTNCEQAALAAERLRLRVMQSEIMAENKETFHWTTSVGVSCLHAGDSSIDDVVARADAELYRAKSLGRNCVSVSDADTHQTLAG